MAWAKIYKEYSNTFWCTWTKANPLIIWTNAVKSTLLASCLFWGDCKARAMNKLFYVVRLKELGLSCLKAELSVKNKARKIGGLVYDRRPINNTRWLWRISKAILSLSVQNKGILWKDVVTLTSGEDAALRHGENELVRNGKMRGGADIWPGLHMAGSNHGEILTVPIFQLWSGKNRINTLNIKNTLN